MGGVFFVLDLIVGVDLIAVVRVVEHGKQKDGEEGESRADGEY